MADLGSPKSEELEVANIAARAFSCSPERCVPVILAFHDYFRANAPVFATDADALLWARKWAAIASPIELKAYALACFEVMPESHRKAFLDHVAGSK